MKTFSIHSVRNLLAVVIALGLGYAAYMVNPSTIVPTKVEAGASQNVSGWAWNLGTKVGTEAADPTAGPYSATVGSNPGLGWISLNSFDCDTNKNGFTDSGTCGGNDTSTIARDYGVNITPLTGTGVFSGTAWSENLGWISFNRAETGTPPFPPFNIATGPIAQVDWATGNVTGWARALSGCEMTAGTPATTCVPTPGTSAGAASGGWDGWIKFARDAGDAGTTAYQVVISGSKFSGNAWGGDVVGWIDFAPVNITSGLPVNTLAQIAPPVCSAGDSASYTYTGQPCVASCVSGGTSSQTVSGTQYASCLDGNSTPPTSQTCGPVALTCSNTTTPTMWFKGDTVCNTALGENSTNSLTDCKPRTKFWQF